MVDSYVECLVQVKKNTGALILKAFVYSLCGICLLGALMTGLTPFFLVGLALAAVGYFLCPPSEIEYEYLYMDKELSIDKIIAKQKRKKVTSFDLSKMEKMCPINSHELDAYKNRNIKVMDFSSKMENSKPFVIVYRDEKGECLVHIEPNADLIKAIKNSCPRKVIEY